MRSSQYAPVSEADLNFLNTVIQSTTAARAVDDSELANDPRLTELPTQARAPLSKPMAKQLRAYADAESNFDLAATLERKAVRCSLCGAQLRFYGDDNGHMFSPMSSSCHLNYCPWCDYRHHQPRRLKALTQEFAAYFTTHPLPATVTEVEACGFEASTPAEHVAFLRLAKRWTHRALPADAGVRFQASLREHEGRTIPVVRLLFTTTLAYTAFLKHPFASLRYTTLPTADLDAALLRLANIDCPTDEPLRQAKYEYLSTGSRASSAMGKLYGLSGIDEPEGEDSGEDGEGNIGGGGELSTSGEGEVDNPTPRVTTTPKCPHCGAYATKISGWIDSSQDIAHLKSEELTWFAIDKSPPCQLRAA